MDNQLLFKVVEELRQQCRFAQFGFQNIRTHLQLLDAEKVFFFVHAFLGHAAVVSSLLWPEKTETRERGERLRKELNVDEDSPLHGRGIGNLLRRPDETFDEWVSGLENRNYVDMNIMPLGTISGFKPDSFQRSLDPENFRLYFRGESCDLRQVCDQLRKVESATTTWLRTHNPW